MVDSGTGYIKIQSGQLAVLNPSDSAAMAQFYDGGAVELYHNNSKKFETTSAGIKVSGSFPDITIHDTDTTNDNFRILHNGGGTQLLVDPNNVGPNASHFIVGIDGTERLRILSTGTVNIGDQGLGSEYLSSTVKIRKDQNSVTRLSLRNENSGSGSASAIQVGAYGNSWMLQCGSAANDSNAFTIRVDGSANSNTGTEKLRITTAGNLGVGNADPTQARLVAQTASGMSIAAVKDNTGASISLGGVTQPRILMEAGASASEFKLYTAGGSSYGSASWTERLRIGSAGEVRIMTANGQLKWTASSGNDPFIRSIGSGEQSLEFNTGGGERLRITSGGDATFKYKINVGDSYAGGEIFKLGKNSGTSYLAHYNGGTAHGFIGHADQLVSGGAATDYAIRATNDLVFSSNGGPERLRIASTGVITHTGKAGAAASTAIDPLSSFVLNDAEARLQLCATNGGSNAAGLILSNESKHFIIHQRGPNVSNRFDIGYLDDSSPTDINNQASRLLSLDSAGNMGLGVTPIAPGNTALHIGESSSGQPVRLHMTTATTGATTSDGFTLSIDGSTSVVNMIQRENSDMTFYTNNTDRFFITSSGGYVQKNFGRALRYYTTTLNDSMYRTVVAISMGGNTAYEIRFTGTGNGITHAKCMASHWTSSYDLIRESYIATDSYSGLSIHDQINRTSGTQGAWSFSRPGQGQTGYQSHLIINKSAGSYGGGMIGCIVLESDRPYELLSVT
jgi:hypothetical protein